ncbi:hypothetical protein BGW80DRAFT_1161500 [Lactifluus volemus]|nr:hypothetical protein BGW80DRAFT_1161500 [Lactifluus volemus]
MSTLSSWLWGTSQLDEAIDKATSELLPAGSEDIALNLEICDQVRSKSVPPKDAMRALKRRLNHKNPNVQLLALNLTDVCIKNGGDHFLVEITSREFIDNLVSILKTSSLNRDVKSKILRCMQTWAISFKGKHNLSYVEQVYKSLKAEGFHFPPEDLAIAGSALVDTQTAPEWIDSDVCLRCRDTFTFTNRKHHCRNCGRVFDQKCSSKTLPLPHFGIAQEVRVCDSCHKDLMRQKDKMYLPVRSNNTHRPLYGASRPEHRSERDFVDADLQRAIQLSLEEVSAQGQHRRPGHVPYQPDPWQRSEPPLVEHTPRLSTQVDEDDDPDLRTAIEASLREANAPKPSAPIGLETPRAEEPPLTHAGLSQPQPYPSATSHAQPVLPNHDLAPLESDTIIAFSQAVDQVQAQGFGDLARFPAVNQLFDNANNLRPKLARSLDDTGRKEGLLNEMNDKLAQAVKLYDQILTQQVSRPTWRQQTASPPRQPHDQWNYVQALTSPQLTNASVTPAVHQPSSTYTPLPAHPPSARADALLPQSPQQTWSQPPYAPSATSPPPLITAPEMNPQHHTAATSQSPTSYQYQYARPIKPVSIQQLAPPAPPPGQAITPLQHPVTSVSVQSPLHQQVSSPPPVPHHQRPQPQQPPSRHNSVVHVAQASPPHLQQQYAPPPAPAPILPNFPSVPTAPPIIPYSSYDSTTSVVEQPKKEALLIEL